MAEERHFAVRLRHSGSGRPQTQRLKLKSLGLSRFGKTVYLKDTPAVRGNIYKVVHLLDVEAHEGPVPPKA